MTNFDRPPSYLARIRAFEEMATATKSREMVAVLRRLVLAYREVARSEMCGAARTGSATMRPGARAVGVPPGPRPAQIQALTRG